MPEPKKGETTREYVSRFMKSKEAQKDFPDPKQRAAVAYSKARQAGRKVPKPKKTTSISEGMVVSKDARVILNGENYLLEKGDVIYLLQRQ